MALRVLVVVVLSVALSACSGSTPPPPDSGQGGGGGVDAGRDDAGVDAGADGGLVPLTAALGAPPLAEQGVAVPFVCLTTGDGAQVEFDFGAAAGPQSVAVSSDGQTWARAVFSSAGTVQARCRLVGASTSDWSASKTTEVYVASTSPFAVALEAGGPTAQVTLDADGGVYELLDGGGLLEVPLGAVSAPTDITAQALTSLAPNALGATLLGGFRLGPDGTAFDVPVTLTLPRAADAGVPLLALVAQADGGARLDFARPAGATLEAIELPHFTDYAEVNVECGAMLALPASSLPTTADALAVQVTRYLCDCAAKQVPQDDAVLAAFIQSYVDAAIEPNLRDAATTDAAIGLARLGILNVLGLMDQLGASGSASPLLTLRTRLVQGLATAYRTGLDRHNAQCRATRNYQPELFPILNIGRWAQRDALHDLAALRFDLASLGQDFCAKPTLVSATMPALAVFDEVNGGTSNLDVTAEVRIDGTVVTGSTLDVSVAWTGANEPLTKVEVASGVSHAFAFSPAPGSDSVTAEVRACLVGVPAFGCDSRTVRSDVLAVTLQGRLSSDPPTALRRLTCVPVGMTGAFVATARKGGQPLAGVTVTVTASGTLAPSQTSIVTSATGEAAFDASASGGFSSLEVAMTDPASQQVSRARLPMDSFPLVQVSPPYGRVPTGASKQFSAQLCGVTNGMVTWSATGGTVDATGRFTAGSAEGTFDVTATLASPAGSGSAQVDVIRLEGTYVGTCQRYYNSFPQGAEGPCAVVVSTRASGGYDVALYPNNPPAVGPCTTSDWSAPLDPTFCAVYASAFSDVSGTPALVGTTNAVWNGQPSVAGMSLFLTGTTLEGNASYTDTCGAPPCAWYALVTRQ